MAQQYGLGRDAVRDAIAVIRAEGLIVTDKSGSHVRSLGEMETVRLPAGTTVTTRMPTEPERREHGIGEGVPVFVVGDRIYPGDRYEISAG